MTLPGRARRLSLRLEADDALPGEFAPFRSPRLPALTTSGIDGALLRTLDLALDGLLAPGRHAVPIGRDAALDAEVAPETRLHLALRVGDEDGAPVLLHGEARFDPPIVLGNVPAVLAALPTLFEDRRVAAVSGWLERLAAHDVPGGLAATLRRALAQAPPWLRHATTGDGGPARALTRLLSGTEQLARIHLGAIHLRPTARGTRCELAFDGYVSWISELPLPFSRASLPSAIIPNLHRRMDRLLSRAPIATAAVHHGRVAPPDALALALGRLLAEAHGHAAFSLDPVAADITLQLADGTTLTADLPALGRVAGHADLHLTRDGDTLALSLDRAALTLPSGEVHGRLGWRGALPGAPRAPWSCTFTAAPGTHLDRLELLLAQSHPTVRGETRATLAATDLHLTGEAALGAAHALDLHASLGFALAGEHRDPRGRLAPRAHGRASLALVHPTGGPLALRLELDAAAQVAGDLAFRPVSELGLSSGVAHAEASMTARGALVASVARQRDGRRVADLAGSRLAITLARARLEADGRRLTLPAGAAGELVASAGEFGDDGLGQALLEVSWDLGPGPLAFGVAADTVDLLPSSARRGRRTVSLGAAGGLRLRPDQAPKRDLGALLDDDALFAPLLAAARLLEPRFGAHLDAVRRFAQRVRRVLDEEGVREPRHALPRASLTRLLGRVLGDDPALVDAAEPIVLAVTRGEGLDVLATRALFDRALPPGHGWNHALYRLIDWLAIVLGPTEVEPPRPRLEALALCDDPALSGWLAALPNAAALYAAAEGGALPDGASLASALPRLAPYLGREQLLALLAAAEPSLPPAVRARTRYVAELSRRAQLVARSYGGLAHLPQALAIGVFLGDASLVTRASCTAAAPGPAAGPADVAAVHDTLLGPADVATLLQAGLTPTIQGRAVQLNQRLLLELLLSRPAGFAVQVLVELSAGSTRVLALALNALLDLEQGLMHPPLDLHAELGQRLGLALPRRADFMAGGSHPRESYYAALHASARQILALGRPYLALRQHLQEVRPARWLPPAPSAAEAQARESAAIDAQRAIASADAFASALDPLTLGADTRAAAVAGYERAFDATARLLRSHPAALAEPWLRDFLGRNHEALTVLRVVHNHADDADDVRRWLRVRSGQDRFASEQDLLLAVVEALYPPAEAAAVRSDPLVRLLVPHPPGRLDFTVVSCMGVITDGARGRELEDSFARLAAARGVALVRADTATFRSLEDNARRVEAAIAEVTTPWGWLGYSQGCANGLAAERRLATGTPAQRRLLAGLRARHLLFSAANGSTHGRSADLKFLRAMVAGDHALKRYQTELSGPVIDLALRALRLTLDSRIFVKTLGGARSLSPDGVLALARDGVFVPHLPTTSVRGRVSPETLPEALEMLSHLLTRQSGSDDHDTQVHVDDAFPAPRLVDGPAARRLADAAIPSRVQATHHWAPLGEDVAFVRTQRDEALAIYDGPRDRLVFPWIELGARFGFIAPARGTD